MKILIVDDNASVRRLIRSVLPTLVSEIYECANGTDALTTYQDRRPDVVLWISAWTKWMASSDRTD